MYHGYFFKIIETNENKPLGKSEKFFTQIMTILNVMNASLSRVFLSLLAWPPRFDKYNHCQQGLNENAIIFMVD